MSAVPAIALVAGAAVAAVAACAGAPAPRPVSDDGLAELTWLAGTWASEDGGVLTEERWTPAVGGTMAGTSRTLSGAEVVHGELLRIERRGADLFYVATPSGQPTHAFRLTRLAPFEAVFEDPEHDFPKRISYRRDGDALHARVEGVEDGNAREASWTFRRVAP